MHMKKLICVVALCLASPLTFADEAAVQMVLDSIHSKGFADCDNKIRETFERSTVRHIETSIPFRDDVKKSALKDEVVVTVDSGNLTADYGWKHGVDSYSFRKVGKQCLMAQMQIVSRTNNNCSQLAEAGCGRNNYILLAETDNLLWVACKNNEQMKVVLTPLPEGGCRRIVLPYDEK